MDKYRTVIDNFSSFAGATIVSTIENIVQYILFDEPTQPGNSSLPGYIDSFGVGYKDFDSPKCELLANIESVYVISSLKNFTSDQMLSALNKGAISGGVGSTKPTWEVDKNNPFEVDAARTYPLSMQMEYTGDQQYGKLLNGIIATDSEPTTLREKTLIKFFKAVDNSPLVSEVDQSSPLYEHVVLMRNASELPDAEQYYGYFKTLRMKKKSSHLWAIILTLMIACVVLVSINRVEKFNPTVFRSSNIADRLDMIRSSGSTGITITNTLADILDEQTFVEFTDKEKAHVLDFPFFTSDYAEQIAMTNDGTIN